LRVTYQELYDALLRALLRAGFEPERAALCARLFADTDRGISKRASPSSLPSGRQVQSL
jgi:LDH2 family malate/lactate/ureidoglycolate dehydrogenase